MKIKREDNDKISYEINNLLFTARMRSHCVGRPDSFGGFKSEKTLRHESVFKAGFC